MKIKITNSKNRSMKERLLKEGPGAGYTIETKGLSNVVVKSATLTNDEQYWRRVEVEATATIDELYAESYYYGTGKMYDIPVKIDTVYLDEYTVENNDVSSPEVLRVIVEDALYENSDTKYVYGGGWAHSTFNGEVGDGGDDLWHGYITDQAAINFIDLAVQGENVITEYRVQADGVDADYYYEEEDEAIAKADELAVDPEYIGQTITVVRWEDYYDFEGMPFDYSEPYTEVVYEVENELQWGDDEDTDYQESFKRKRTESVRKRSRKVNEWHDRTDGSYMQKEEMGKRGVIAEAKRLGARLIKSTDSKLAYKLVDEGFECICYSYDSYGNVSACVAGKNISAKNLPNDSEEYVYTNASGAASSILANA